MLAMSTAVRPASAPSIPSALAIMLAALLVGLAGVLIEMAILRRIYRAPELFQLLATFAVVLVIKDITLFAWGPEDLVGPRAPGLSTAVEIMGRRIPQYDLLLIVVGPAVLGAMLMLLKRTRWGALVRAATQDREMVGALGVDQAKLFTSVFFVGAVLAGLAGALQIPREPANLDLDLLHQRLTVGWRGRKAAIMAIVGRDLLRRRVARGAPARKKRVARHDDDVARPQAEVRGSDGRRVEPVDRIGNEDRE